MICQKVQIPAHTVNNIGGIPKHHPQCAWLCRHIEVATTIVQHIKSLVKVRHSNFSLATSQTDFIYLYIYIFFFFIIVKSSRTSERVKDGDLVAQWLSAVG